jgi:hypothetical protein
VSTLFTPPREYLQRWSTRSAREHGFILNASLLGLGLLLPCTSIAYGLGPHVWFLTATVALSLYLILLPGEGIWTALVVSLWAIAVSMVFGWAFLTVPNPGLLRSTAGILGVGATAGFGAGMCLWSPTLPTTRQFDEFWGPSVRYAAYVVVFLAIFLPLAPPQTWPSRLRSIVEAASTAVLGCAVLMLLFFFTVRAFAILGRSVRRGAQRLAMAATPSGRTSGLSRVRALTRIRTRVSAAQRPVSRRRPSRSLRQPW